MSLFLSIDWFESSEPISVPNTSIILPGNLRKTIILVHGLTGTPNEVRYIAFFLNRAGYTVVCPCLAKHGQPLSILKHANWEDFHATVRSAFLDALAKGDQVYVGGLSMSALFALLLAEEFPDKLAGAICLAPTLFFDGWNVPWYNSLLPLAAYTPLKYCLYFRDGPPYGIKNERIRAMVHTFYSKARLDNLGDVSKFGYAFFPVSLFHEVRELARHIIPLLGKIKAPVLLVHPQEDDTASLKNSQLIYDQIGSTRKKLVVLRDSYHVITADQERDAVAREILSFLTEP